MTERVRETPIDGLHWKQNFFVSNGGQSRVLPIPTTHPVHVVFHGSKPFNHGHYGLHVGLIDNLTFLGNPRQRAIGRFVDCRVSSPTFGVEFTEKFCPSVGQTLHIPNGVAHSFEGLQDVFTINAYEARLPPPQLLVTEKNPWAQGADIVNFPFGTALSELPRITENRHVPSEAFYRALRVYQSETLNSVKHDYPFTQEASLDDGTVAKLMLWKRIDRSRLPPEVTTIDGIDGLCWRRHFIIMGDDETGYSALLDPGSINVIDHGEERYSHDAYGIHLMCEDRLTFVGDAAQEVTARFADCRRGSKTFGAELVVKFRPSPIQFLCVPPGVAHAFEGLENVFTINRARKVTGDLTQFAPGNDTLDWPLEKRPVPELQVEAPVEVPVSYYEELVGLQQKYIADTLANGRTVSTQMGFLFTDDVGQTVRLSVRQRNDESLARV
jgi:dTDP-4-dehydrorhamnose 3,5-epimerase-like enzyme